MRSAAVAMLPCGATLRASTAFRHIHRYELPATRWPRVGCDSVPSEFKLALEAAAAQYPRLCRAPAAKGMGLHPRTRPHRRPAGASPRRRRLLRSQRPLSAALHAADDGDSRAGCGSSANRRASPEPRAGDSRRSAPCSASPSSIASAERMPLPRWPTALRRSCARRQDRRSRQSLRHRRQEARRLRLRHRHARRSNRDRRHQRTRQAGRDRLRPGSPGRTRSGSAGHLHHHDEPILPRMLSPK